MLPPTQLGRPHLRKDADDLSGVLICRSPADREARSTHQIADWWTTHRSGTAAVGGRRTAKNATGLQSIRTLCSLFELKWLLNDRVVLRLCSGGNKSLRATCSRYCCLPQCLERTDTTHCTPFHHENDEKEENGRRDQNFQSVYRNAMYSRGEKENGIPMSHTNTAAYPCFLPYGGRKLISA